MKTERIAILAFAISTVAMVATACGSGGDAPTALQLTQQLKDAGVACDDTSRTLVPAEDLTWGAGSYSMTAPQHTILTCDSSAGTVQVLFFGSEDDARDGFKVACLDVYAQPDAQPLTTHSDEGSFPAVGDSWIAQAESGALVTSADVARALGGKQMNLAELCAPFQGDINGITQQNSEASASAQAAKDAARASEKAAAAASQSAQDQAAVADCEPSGVAALTDPRLVAVAATCPDPAARRAAAGSVHADVATMQSLLGDADPSVRAGAAANPVLPPDLVDIALADSDPTVRAALVRGMFRGQGWGKQPPVTILDRLVNDDAPEVRSAVAGVSYHLTQSQRQTLADDADAGVVSAIVEDINIDSRTTDADLTLLREACGRSLKLSFVAKSVCRQLRSIDAN